jgi:hypothetical protein
MPVEVLWLLGFIVSPHVGPKAIMLASSTICLLVKPPFRNLEIQDLRRQADIL